jgi:hypothetical protein
MMEVKDGLEEEVALPSTFGKFALRDTMYSQWGRQGPASLGVLLHDVHGYHALPPNVPNPMHEPYCL